MHVLWHTVIMIMICMFFVLLISFGYWVHLNTDYPFLLNGILYFPKLKPDVDVSKGQIKLFCNQVFVSDNCEEIIPEFLMPLRGVIDSPDIPLNVSRSALTNHRTVRRISDFISKKIGDRLKSLYKEDKKKYIDSWEDVGLSNKLAAAITQTETNVSRKKTGSKAPILPKPKSTYITY